MSFFYYLIPVLVTAWTVWGVFDYKKLKLALAKGQRAALLKEYKITVFGEIVGSALVLAAVGIGIFHPVTSFHVVIGVSQKSLIDGTLIGVALGTIVIPLTTSRKKNNFMIGDIQTLLPKTTQEKYCYACVALSAGIGEELIFRGFGLRLFQHIGLSGIILLIISALAFGLIHIYQGLAGVAATAVLGFFLALIYIASGSLLVPIVIHAAIDLRALLLPSAEPAVKKQLNSG